MHEGAQLLPHLVPQGFLTGRARSGRQPACDFHARTHTTSLRCPTKSRAGAGLFPRATPSRATIQLWYAGFIVSHADAI
jgi:hypothetical protein